MGKREGTRLQSLSAPVVEFVLCVCPVFTIREQAERDESESQHRVTGWIPAWGGQPDLTAASSPPPLTHHPDSSTSGTQPVPAHLCRQSRAPAHSVGAALGRASFLHPVTFSRNSEARRPGQGWVGLSHILVAAAVPEPPWRTRAAVVSDRLAAPRGPHTQVGGVTALPAAPTVQPTRPRCRRPLLTLPHPSPRCHASRPLASAGLQPRALSPLRPVGPGKGRTPSGPQLPRMRRARRAVPGPF